MHVRNGVLVYPVLGIMGTCMRCRQFARAVSCYKAVFGAAAAEEHSAQVCKELQVKECAGWSFSLAVSNMRI